MPVTKRATACKSSPTPRINVVLSEQMPTKNSKPSTWPPLEAVTRPTAPTEQAAYYLNRQPQTLRGWACSENGPLRPIRVHGKLAWPVAAIRALLGAV